MNPADTSRPFARQFVHGFVQVDGEILRLVSFAQGSVDGVSMPTNTESKPAHIRFDQPRPRRARLMLASV